MAITELGLHTHTPAIEIRDISDLPYDDLLIMARQYADAYGVPDDVRVSGFDLLEVSRRYDQASAQDSLQTVPLALTTAHALTSCDIEVNFVDVWAGAMTHDVGKSCVDREVIDVSNGGQMWGPDYYMAIRKHVPEGARMIYDSDLPIGAYLAEYAHHSRQQGVPSYGLTDKLFTPAQLATTNCVRIADTADAMMHRTNTRNAHMTRAERLAWVHDNNHFILGESALAHAVNTELLPRL